MGYYRRRNYKTNRAFFGGKAKGKREGRREAFRDMLRGLLWGLQFVIVVAAAIIVVQGYENVSRFVEVLAAMK